ncbi:lipocalin [Cereibacter sphaeroides]|uniref:lipocalin n=1 Tax=Cereibacter sphaeroides TaxID=1063 RepID=UPI001F2B4280|nr:lipocalin [Cereibacter sphaeroides]MCE6949665.1 lipocalin [Cereibacter sphaeroides]
MRRPPRLRGLVPAAFAVLALLLPAPVRGQSYELGRSGDLVVSERLRILAQGRALADGASPMARTLSLKADMIAQGFYHEGGLERVMAEASLSPTLGWSPNLNGGVANSRIGFAGGWLEIDPAYVAKPGATAGLLFESEVRLSWGTGRFLQAELDGAVARARESGYERRDRRLLLCSRNHLQGWSFLDLCLRQSESDRSLSRQEQRETSIQFAHLLTAENSYHEIRLELGDRRQPDYSQPRAGLELHSVWSGLATRIGLGLGPAVEGRTVERCDIFADLRWRLAGAVTGLSLWRSHASGGEVFGIAQTDVSTGLALFRQITPQLDLSVQYVRTRSTVDLFDSRQLGLDVSWRFHLR